MTIATCSFSRSRASKLSLAQRDAVLTNWNSRTPKGASSNWITLTIRASAIGVVCQVATPLTRSLPRETACRTRLQRLQPFRDNFRRIAVKAPDDGSVPFWDNGWFPPLDAICLYGLVASPTNPRLYLEVGSGNSTKFVRRAIEDHKLRTKIISIDPQPRAVVDQLCDEVVRHSFGNC